MPERPSYPEHECCRKRALALLKTRQCETPPADLFAYAKGKQPKHERTHNPKIW